ncbi:hypothetical protein [Paraburkholderia sp. RAU2J]|uniref:hypothetical protein n=1 Tax=Paraburkholderia sp. RAU2J TaxID=1938810 RepID=UPI000EAE57C5|nr:hypothetical protein [Paraburkholderia sp. RAU2J]
MKTIGPGLEYRGAMSVHWNYIDIHIDLLRRLWPESVRLTEQFSEGAREETRRDEVTGSPYRVNLAVTTWQGKEQMTLWTDIDAAPRHIAHKSLVQRREQMVGDAVQLTFDVMHWNRINDVEDPINMPLDLTDDVEWQINAPDKDAEAA